jgi:hypothetical protein
MERTAHWYSIVQYCPNEMRGEKVNIGLILHAPEEGKVLHSLLDETSNKVKGLALDEVSLKTFKAQKDVFDFYFKKIKVEHDLLAPQLTESDFLERIKGDMPKDFVLSVPSFSLTRNTEQLFESLSITYIGEMTYSKEIISTEDIRRNVKNYTKSIFAEREWMGTKVRSNVKVHPIEGMKNIHFNVDFIFRNGLWNIIHTVPSNSTNEKLIEWYSKTNTMIENVKKDTDFYIVYDDKDELNEDKTITQMVTLLKTKDQRVNSTEIESDSFDILCTKVEKEAKDLSPYENELIAM